MRKADYEQHARELLGMPPEWRAFHWEMIGDGDAAVCVVTGAVVREMFQRGPRKGTPNWKKRDKRTERKAAISKRDHAQWLLAWEAETGLCLQCEGTGQEWAGWNREKGTLLRACSRCGASGKAPPAQEPAP